MFTTRRDARRAAEWQLKYGPTLAFAPVGLSTLVVVPVEMIPHPEFDKMIAKSTCRVLCFILWHRRSHGVRGLSLEISRSFEKERSPRSDSIFTVCAGAPVSRGPPRHDSRRGGKILLRTKSSWAGSNGVLSMAINGAVRHGGHFFPTLAVVLVENSTKDF